MNPRVTALLQGWLSRLTLWRAILIAILVVGLYAAVVRFSQGLGAVTHLSDSFPWGLWIGFDVLVGVGLAAGGFVIAATVHVFRIKKYEPIARPAVLTAFLGYLLVIVALLFDLGRPYRIWHPLVMWNAHSVMFEVAWCVMLYTVVLALEFSPLLFERLKMHRALRIVRAAFVPLVIVGVLLSTLHQSSLGTLYVIAPDKLHGLWYTPLLPLFFFFSAVAAGLCMTIFESFMSYRAFGKRLEGDLLRGLGRVCTVVLAIYLVLRFQDLATRGNLSLAFQPSPESVLFWGEIGLGAVLPMVLFAIRRVRRQEKRLFLAAMLTIMGFIVNRLNVAITGMMGSSGVSYFPSWMEIAVTSAIVAAGFALFGLAVKHLSVFPKEELQPFGLERRKAELLRHYPAFDGKVLVSLWALMVVGAVGVFFTTKGSSLDVPEAAAAEAATRAAPAALSFPDPYTFPASADSPGRVTFYHDSHVDPRAPDCATCHARHYSINQAGQPLRGVLSYERIHQEDLCASCHNGRNAFSIDDGCDICHGR